MEHIIHIFHILSVNIKMRVRNIKKKTKFIIQKIFIHGEYINVYGDFLGKG